jgi:hypothetical protein
MTRPSCRFPGTDQEQVRHGKSSAQPARPAAAARAAERLRREGYSGPLLPESAETQELIEQVYAETELPCRATFLDDPLFGVRASRVTGMTAGGDLLTEDEGDADQEGLAHGRLSERAPVGAG